MVENFTFAEKAAAKERTILKNSKINSLVL